MAGRRHASLWPPFLFSAVSVILLLSFFTMAPVSRPPIDHGVGQPYRIFSPSQRVADGPQRPITRRRPLGASLLAPRTAALSHRNLAT